MAIYQPIDAWQDPHLVVEQATALMTSTGDVLVAVLDLESFNRSREETRPPDQYDLDERRINRTAAEWIRAVHRETRPTSVDELGPQFLAPPILVLGEIDLTAPEVQDVSAAGAAYVPKPQGYLDGAPWEVRESLLRQHQCLIDPAELFAPLPPDAETHWPEDEGDDELPDDQEATHQTTDEDEPQAMPGEPNALEIFSDPTLGLPAADFARLFAVARGYRDERPQSQEEQEG